MEKTYITQALSNLGFVGSCLTENELVTDWLGNTPIDEALITAEVTRLQAEFDSQAYARSRKQEYDKLNQWEMQFDDNRDGTTTWVDSINEIKSQFPKG
jgi:hypothetical protein